MEDRDGMEKPGSSYVGTQNWWRMRLWPIQAFTVLPSLSYSFQTACRVSFPKRTLSCAYKEPSHLNLPLFQLCSGQPSALWHCGVQHSRVARLIVTGPCSARMDADLLLPGMSFSLVHLTISLLVTEDLVPRPT